MILNHYTNEYCIRLRTFYHTSYMNYHHPVTCWFRFSWSYWGQKYSYFAILKFNFYTFSFWINLFLYLSTRRFGKFIRIYIGLETFYVAKQHCIQTKIYVNTWSHGRKDSELEQAINIKNEPREMNKKLFELNTLHWEGS